MADQVTTLRYLLSQQKPSLPCTVTSQRNTMGARWPELENSVAIWDEFNLKILNESYGHVLDYAIPDHLLVCPQPDQALAGVVLNRAEDINHLIGWNHALMEPTLQFAKSHLGLHPGVILHHKHSTPDKSALAKLPNAPGRLNVDHIVGVDDYPGPNLVVGLGRPSSKWRGIKLADQLSGSNKELLWPVRQLANICKFAKTRYGYIQTDEEMVVCCFSNDAERWKVAIMPIPWSLSGVEVLTTDLALWWLCMLAMSALQHRVIVGEAEMVKINEWEIVCPDEERGWMRRHRYSNFEEPFNPPPPLNYTVPLPGNDIAPAAGVGLDPNEWLNADLTTDPFMSSLVDFGAPNSENPNSANIFDLDPRNFDFSQ